jgi:hypothetical protein
LLFDPARHEPLQASAWDDARARAAMDAIVRDAEDAFSPQAYWPLHPRDADGGDTAPVYDLYLGAAGVIWALRYLAAASGITLRRDYAGSVGPLVERDAAWLRAAGSDERASYLMGDTGILLLRQWLQPSHATAARLAQLIEANERHPARELMWGAPGTMLAALFLHERTGEPRWAELFRASARQLWSELQWSDRHRCHYWTQDLYGPRSTYLDAVHGFVATALPLIRGRHLLDAPAWPEWEARIVETVSRTVTREGALANWRPWLDERAGDRRPLLMQYCHGAPGFVVCLAGMPGTQLDELLLAAGEAIWRAGPLRKGPNLCHGTGGNGYAFLKLYERTSDPRWLERARAFAMHGIAQTEADAARHGRMRYSLWTGDPGFAVYLWDCVRGRGEFPVLDVFFR